MEPINNHIAILMATYNGERYLGEQIDSILAQTCQDWHLYIHDDDSKDNTVSIINTYIEHHPEKITRLEYPPQGSACRNFISMLQCVNADYYMFSDQDDLWEKEKVELSMLAMLEEERSHPNLPVVVHSDLRIVDDNLNLLHRSFFEYANLHPELIRRYEEHMQNIVTGSTMLFNSQAKTVALSRSPRYATMHDAWITLRVIAEGGIRHTIFKQLTSYRQHANNVLGAQDGNRFTLHYRLTHAFDMLRLNWQHFLMLRSAGNISCFTYIQNKYKSFKQYHKI